MELKKPTENLNHNSWCAVRCEMDTSRMKVYSVTATRAKRRLYICHWQDGDAGNDVDCGEGNGIQF
jgi:hypothetical protein